MTTSFASGITLYLAKKLTPAGILTVTTNPGPTNGRLFFQNDNQVEWIEYTTVTPSGSNYILGGLTRDIDQYAIPAQSNSTGKTWLATQTCVLVEMHDQMLDINKPTQNLQVAKTYASTAARDAALGADGAAAYNYVDIKVTATGLFYNYNLSSGQWEVQGTGTATPNASELVSGSVQILDQTDVDAGEEFGSTGAYGVVDGKTFQQGITNRISDQATAEAGVNNTELMTSLSTKQAIDYNIKTNGAFGSGADGAVAGALTVAGSNSTYILKQYTSFAPGANTVTITPTDCILHIKVQGDCDLTGTTFNFAGKGGQGGNGGGNSTNGANGGKGTSLLSSYDLDFGDGGTAVTSGPTPGVGGAGAVKTYTINSLAGLFNTSNTILVCGTGGGGGGGIYSTIGPVGGNGGNGGGCLLLEVGGNLILTGATLNFNGTNGNDGTDGAGGSGGGGGGLCIIGYRGTLTGSATPNVTGGTKGNGGSHNSGGTGQATAGGGGGGGGIFSNGSNGSNGATGTGTQLGGNGGNGGVGLYLIQKIVS